MKLIKLMIQNWFIPSISNIGVFQCLLFFWKDGFRFFSWNGDQSFYTNQKTHGTWITAGLQVDPAAPILLSSRFLAAKYNA